MDLEIEKGIFDLPNCAYHKQIVSSLSTYYQSPHFAFPFSIWFGNLLLGLPPKPPATAIL